jgi:glycosyltransferase involved in cell wall biosynthesis
MKKEFCKPDIIHVHVLTRLGIIALLYKLITGIPYLITEHWSRYLPTVGTYRGFWRKLATRIVVKNAGAITTVTKNLSDAMQSHRLNNKNYQVIQNVVDTELFHPAELSIQGIKKRFIHISCFEDRSKNISGLLRSLALLHITRNDFECQMIGEGMDLERMKKLADELGIHQKIVFFSGLLEGETLALAMREASFLVLFSNYENMPVVINEAFASGIPVVATRVGGIAEHVDETKGILVEAGDEKGMAKSLSQMLDTCEAYDKSLIRNYALEHFSKKAIAEQFISIYKGMIRKSKNSSQ